MTCVRLLSVSWPRPSQYEGARWISAPDWDAPLMPRVPEWRVQTIQGESCDVIDWRATFGGDLHRIGARATGEMKGFHVVFHLRVERSGILVFFDDDGSIIRKNGELVHEDREAHELIRHELCVTAGDRLDVAQWQHRGDWMWAARLEASTPTRGTILSLFEPYRRRVEEALREPNGPVLKTFTSAIQPVRCALSIYSMIVNGYRPAGVQIFGDYQWNERGRRAIEALMPFGEIVPIHRVEHTLNTLNRRLFPIARRIGMAMKTCVSLFCPPYDFCYLDDDVFILDRVSDALTRRSQCDLVYAPDRDYDAAYRAIWDPARAERYATGDVNGGLYFMRNRKDIFSQITRFLKTAPNGHQLWQWEQGFLASEFADAKTHALPAQRYFYPVYEGLPGGVLGYDWRENPCDFVSVHFGGLRCKPTDDDALILIHDILGRNRMSD
jgi:hypothetical protein